ncbi:MAG TPA: universal stress protein [Hanamia sp.]|nr:universal stress protein [Hanamia sp.]
MKKIILATDFSKAALNAANYAADMSLAINAEILLLHAYQVKFSYSDIPVAMNEEEMRQDIERAMKQLKEDLWRKTKNKIDIKTEVRTGVFIDELKAVCELVKPYAVIIGSQGKTASERFWFGSHAVQVMKNLRWPLIAVPTGAQFSTPKKIGLAWDLNEVPVIAQVEEIKKIVNDFNTELHIINTGKPGVYDPDTVVESMKLEKLMKPVIPVYHFIADKNTDEGIIRFAEKNNLDLLIVMPKHHSFFDTLTHKSHTKQLVFRSYCPVMVLN